MIGSLASTIPANKPLDSYEICANRLASRHQVALRVTVHAAHVHQRETKHET